MILLQTPTKGGAANHAESRRINAGSRAPRRCDSDVTQNCCAKAHTIKVCDIYTSQLRLIRALWVSHIIANSARVGIDFNEFTHLSIAFIL
jgi:hypothetical protein